MDEIQSISEKFMLSLLQDWWNSFGKYSTNPKIGLTNCRKSFFETDHG